VRGFTAIVKLGDALFSATIYRRTDSDLTALMPIRYPTSFLSLLLVGFAVLEAVMSIKFGEPILFMSS
jgi:hypothetical protein